MNLRIIPSPHNSSELAVLYVPKILEVPIKNLLLNIKQSSFKPDIILVDGFSTDDTVKIQIMWEELR